MFPFIKIFADLFQLKAKFLRSIEPNPPTLFIKTILTQLSLNHDEQHHDSEERPFHLRYNFFMSLGYLGPFLTEQLTDQAVRRSLVGPTWVKIFNSFLNQFVITFIGTYMKPVSSSDVAFLSRIFLCTTSFSFK